MTEATTKKVKDKFQTTIRWEADLHTRLTEYVHALGKGVRPGEQPKIGQTVQRIVEEFLNAERQPPSSAGAGVGHPVNSLEGKPNLPYSVPGIESLSGDVKDVLKKLDKALVLLQKVADGETGRDVKRSFASLEKAINRIAKERSKGGKGKEEASRIRG